MDATTRGAPDVDRLDTAQDVGEKLNKMQVGRRTTQNVGAALNEQPNAPTDPRARRVRREMQRNERGGYWEGIMASDFADQDDGVPLELVLATHEYAIAVLKARAPSIRLDRPLATYWRAEMNAEHPLNVAQEVAVANPNDPEVLERVAQRGRGYLAVLREMIAFCDERSIVLRRGGQARRVYGARRRMQS